MRASQSINNGNFNIENDQRTINREIREKKYSKDIKIIASDRIPPLNFMEILKRLVRIEKKIIQYYEEPIYNLEEYKAYQREIWNIIEKEKFYLNINFVENMAMEDFEEFLGKLYAYVNETKHAIMKNKSTLLSEQSAEDDLVNVILDHIQVPVDPIPGLYETIAEMRGHNYHLLTKNRGKRCSKEGKFYGQILDRIHCLGKDLITVFSNEKFDKDKGYLICKAFFGREIDKIIRIMDYIADELVPNIHQAY